VDNNKNSSPFKGEVRRGMGATIYESRITTVDPSFTLALP